MRNLTMCFEWEQGCRQLHPLRAARKLEAELMPSRFPTGRGHFSNKPNAAVRNQAGGPDFM